MDIKQIIGSKTAKGGFENENDVVNKFLNYKNDLDAQNWLKIMGYDYNRVSNLDAKQIPVSLSKVKALEFGISDDGFELTKSFKKEDIQIKLEIKIDGISYIENISAKKANKSAGFNQVDKRSVDKYSQIWDIPNNISNTLKYFTGELKPYKDSRDSRRMFLNEINEKDVEELIDFITNNKVLIFNDILKGRGPLSASWMLVTINDNENIQYVLKDINYVCNFYSQGNIEITPRGSLKIGRVTMQRKGGTPDPTSLQFKINPIELFNKKERI